MQLISSHMNGDSDDTMLLTAGIAIAGLPIVILYMVFQRRVVTGIAIGAVKG